MGEVQFLGSRDLVAPRVRRVVRDAEYSWSATTMMSLYSGTTDPFSQRCRIVLFEKGMDFQVIDVDLFNKPEDIAVINPYNRVPVLVDRDLVLYESNIINEYIDERFPHPQLMPPDPIMRARARQLLHTMEVELFSHIESLWSSSRLFSPSRNSCWATNSRCWMWQLRRCCGALSITPSTCPRPRRRCSNMPNVFSAARVSSMR